MTNSCEKLELQIDRWIRLPDMQYARWFFNPCVFQGLIYLSGRCDGQVMEVFSPERDILLPITLSLPEKDSPCCVYVDKDLLVLYSESFIVKFEAGPNGQLRQLSQIRVSALHKGQSSQPVVDRTRGMFCMTWEGLCVQVEMETGREVGRISGS